MSDEMKNYRDNLRQKEARDGHNPGRLYIAGWKLPSKKSLVQLYRDGKITYDQVGRAQKNLKPSDHVEALKHKKVNESQLEALGISVYRQSSRKSSDPSGGRVIQKAKVEKEDWSNSPKEIQQIMREWEIRQAAKKASVAKGKRGFEPVLTKQEKVDMFNRHYLKGARAIVK
jgi:hypothetical protein